MRKPVKLNLSLDGSISSVIDKSKNRIILYSVIVFLIYFAIAFKLIKLTFFLELEYEGAKFYNEQFEKAERLPIYDRNGILIATNLKTNSLYADARNLKNPTMIARQLRKIFPELNEQDLIKKLSSKKAFVWIKRNLHPMEMKAVNDLGIPYLNFDVEVKRTYPHLNLFSHTLGMVGVDAQGLTGFEKYIDGIDEAEFEIHSANGRVDTSLDVRIQSLLHTELLNQMKKHEAKFASGLVMDVNSGEILALVNLPDYDPNTPQSLTISNQFNSITLGNYEMGSTFKPITFAIGLEKKLVNLKTVIDASEPIKIGRFKISDYKGKFRPLALPEIMMYSSNIGTAKIAEIIGASTMQEYYKKLGFYEKVGIEIKEKSIPMMPKNWNLSTTLTASFGHGVSVTPLHVAIANATLVNGGMLVKPTIIKNHKSKNNPRIFSEETSETMRKLYRLVVTGGSGKSAEAKGYFVGGKTGTSEKVVDGKYVPGVVIASFVGMFPMNKPRYLVLAIFDEPKPTPDTYGYATGGWVAAPVVSRVIEGMAPILKISPINYEDETLIKRFDLGY
ncbi:MAG: penicillin-binding protein 2 [Rickettsiales bacterium]|nr:penicillin-binding protein 2 [Rickettsiales bacterium]